MFQKKIKLTSYVLPLEMWPLPVGIILKTATFRKKKGVWQLWFEFELKK